MARPALLLAAACLAATCRTEIACGQPTRYENSYVNLVNGTSTVDSVAVYTCKPGHIMSAESTKTMIVCLEGGIWEDPDFTCEADGEVLPVLFGVKEFESNDFSNDKNPKGLGTTGIVSTTALCVFLLILLSVAAACVVKRYQTFKENQASSAANSDCSYDNDKESLSNIEILNNTTAVPAISYGDHRIYNDVLPPIIEAEEPLEMKSLHGSYGDISGGDFRRNNFMYANRATGMPELHIAGASTSFTRPESPNSRCCYKTADSPESVITHTCPNIPNDRTVNNVRESEIKDKLPWSIPTSIKSFFSLTKKFSDNGQTNRVDLRQPKENNKVGNGAIRRTIEPQCHRITNTAKQNSNQYRDVETGVRDYVMIDFKSDDVPDLTPYGSTIASYNSDVL